jgi:hypothetical protein
MWMGLPCWKAWNIPCNRSEAGYAMTGSSCCKVNFCERKSDVRFGYAVRYTGRLFCIKLLSLPSKVLPIAPHRHPYPPSLPTPESNSTFSNSFIRGLRESAQLPFHSHYPHRGPFPLHNFDSFLTSASLVSGKTSTNPLSTQVHVSWISRTPPLLTSSHPKFQ